MKTRSSPKRLAFGSDTFERPVEPASQTLDVRSRRSWGRTVRGYLLLPHLPPVLVVELATTAFAVIAWGGVPPPQLLGSLLLAMLGGQLAIGATNELVDLPFDTIGKPWKPLVSGDVSLRGARVMVVVGLLMMAGFGSRFGPLALTLLAAGTALGIAYDLWFKRTVWSWLPYLLALPLLPIWVFASLGKPEPRLLLLYPLGALATVGVHFAQALPDVAIDRAAGLPTATSRLGQWITFVVAWLTTLSAPVFARLAARWLAVEQPYLAIDIAAGLTLLLLTGNVIMFAADRRVGIAACFPLVALATLSSGLAWTLTLAQ
ncbi:MAG TPA: UbiA family prenyltransferase [Thermomicrobiales bacterium]|nr:UbiA family prenyltransferase [Thermomicrobiales bacterium]